MTDVVIPVKDLRCAKSRLQSLLPPDERAGLVLAMLRDVLETLADCDLGNVWLVACDDAVFEHAAEFGVCEVREPRSRGHNAAVRTGLSHVGRDVPVIVLPADLPLIQPGDIARLASVGKGSAGLVPDRHRSGTNGMVLPSSDVIEPHFGPNSLVRHQEAALGAGVAVHLVPSRTMAADIDGEEDVIELAECGSSCASVDFLRETTVVRRRLPTRRKGVA